MAKEKIILGVDPGTTIMGFGLIKIVDKKMEFLQKVLNFSHDCCELLALD